MINNESQLIKLMMKDLEKTMLQISEKILNRWRELITSNWYNAHDESEYYTRTYEFLESLTSTGLIRITNGFEIVLFFDTSAMSIKRNGGFWQHKQRAILPDLIEEGYTTFGKRFEGAHAYEELMDEIKKKNYFMDEIRQQFGESVKLKIN